MQIGDMVVRAYAWHALVPGVIVDCHKEVKPLGEDCGDEYIEHLYIVAWSDGSESRELYEELDYLEDILEHYASTQSSNG